MTNTRLGYEPLTVLVTGGAGFIGSHVAEALVARGEDVVVLDDLSSGKRENLPEGVDFVEGDVREPQDELFAGVKPTVCYHLAAQIDVRVSVARPDHDAQINVLGTVNILQAALELGTQVVFSSTGGAIYGECDGPASEDAPRRPIAPYGTSKLAGEEYLATFNRLHGTRHVSLRYGNVYGPRQDPHGEAGVVAIFFNRLREGDRPKIFGDGSRDAGLRVRGRRRARDARGRRPRRRGLQRRHRARDVGGRAARGVPADCGHEHRGGVRRALGPGSCSGACSTRRAPSTSSAGGPRRASRTACARPGSSSGASRNGAGRAESGPSRGDLGPSPPPASVAHRGDRRFRPRRVPRAAPDRVRRSALEVVVRGCEERGAEDARRRPRASRSARRSRATQTRVLVLNGNGITGAAAAESDSLLARAATESRGPATPPRATGRASSSTGPEGFRKRSASRPTKASHSSARSTASPCASSTAPTWSSSSAPSPTSHVGCLAPDMA